MRPYIGITDFRTKEQSLAMLQVLREATASHIHRHRLAIGVMMSWPTLHGHPSSWAPAFAKNEEVADIFLPESDVYDVLHYADYKDRTTLEDLLLAREWGGPHLSAIQLDMTWPDPNFVHAFREKHPTIEIIIQANEKSFELVGESPAAFVEKLREYGRSIDYVLLDKSMGRGLGMDAQSLLPFALAIEEHLSYLAIAAGGGLGPDTFHLVGPLAYALPGISVDAQSQLRESGSARDPINWDMAKIYLQRMATYLAENQFDRR